MNLDTAPPTPVQPLKALKALLALRHDPQDTRQVFLLTEALRGRSPFKLRDRFRADAQGRERLAERRSLLPTLRRLDWLAQLPPGSFGRVYHDFLAEQNLSAQGLVDVAKSAGMTQPDDGSDRHYIGCRLRDMHDLFHVLTGYGRDELGEVCVLAFSYPQQYTRSFAVIAFFGALALRRRLRTPGVLGAVWQAWRHGRAAAWLVVQPLESLLERDLRELREELNIAPPTRYLAVTDRMRAQGRAIPLPPGRTV